MFSLPITGIVLGVIAAVVVAFAVFVTVVIYRRNVAIRRKRAMRRYLERGEVCLRVCRTHLTTLSS